MSKLQAVLKAIFYVTVFAYLFGATAAFFLQRSLLYYPSHRDAAGQGLGDFKPLTASDGAFVGYVKEPTVPVKRVVILFHGNAGEAIDRAWLAQLIPYSDVALVLAEYPGYGARAGKPTESALVEAGKALVALARERWQVPVTVMGESLGTGVASAVAREPGIDRIALISPFHSIQEIAQDMFLWLPMDLFLRDKYRSSEYLKGVSLPLYVVHGTVDDVVPFEAGQRLFREYGGAVKTFKALEGVSHNDIVPHLISSPEAEEFRAFVRTN